MKSARWRDFNALRRADVSFQVTRRVVAPKSNIVYEGNCSTKGGRLIHALSNFDHGFRDLKMMYSEKFCKSLRPPVFEFHFCESITAGRCEAKKLYVTKQPVP